MMTKALLLLALTLCCCFSTVHAYHRQGCRCIRTSSNRIPIRVIEKIETIPISGSCRQVEIIVTRRNGSKLCIDPTALWLANLFRTLQSKNVTSNSTPGSPTASTV